MPAGVSLGDRNGAGQVLVERMSTTKGLRRRLGVLVYRDAARAHGVGVALAMLPLVYLYREWPPWVIRDALHELPTPERAGVIAAAHVVYGLATAPLCRQLLASERLRWWWTLPLDAAWWRRLHLGHLALLDALWFIAIGYGVAALVAREGIVSATCSGLAFVALTLAGQIALVSLADRAVVGRGMALLGLAIAIAIAVLVPGPVALLLGGLALGPAVWRLGRPLPEARARTYGLAGGPPVLALARLGWLAVRRHDGVALTWGLLVQLGATMLVGLAIVHVGATEPASVRSLMRGLAVVCATVGAAVGLRSTRIIQADRPLMDTWGIEPQHERGARALLAAAGVLPALLVGAPLLAWLHPLGRAWPLELAVATAWAALVTVRETYALEAARALQTSQAARWLLRMGVALVLVGAAGSILALLPWAALEAWRLPAAQRRADAARQRYETAQRNDHRS